MTRHSYLVDNAYPTVLARSDLVQAPALFLATLPGVIVAGLSALRLKFRPEPDGAAESDPVSRLLLLIPALLLGLIGLFLFQHVTGLDAAAGDDAARAMRFTIGLEYPIFPTRG